MHGIRTLLLCQLVLVVPFCARSLAQDLDAGVPGADASLPLPVDPPLEDPGTAPSNEAAPTQPIAEPSAPAAVVPAAAPQEQSEPPARHEHPHQHMITHRHAHGAAEPHESTVGFGAVAQVREPPRAASSRVLKKRDLPRGPGVQSEDLVRAVPGVFVVQHAGGGKATQYFLRGFDADHGTDIALSVDGVPVNQVSHGHGQGYADLHFVIPELVQRVTVAKGPYDPRNGDFATAGAIDMSTFNGPVQSQATVSGGMFKTYRGFALASRDIGPLRITGAGEFYGTDGPFDRPQDLTRYNLFARLSHLSDVGELSLTATGYGSDWNASGQIPLRSVRAGDLDRFGSIDPNEGGSSTRHSVYARFVSGPRSAQRWNVLGYVVDYDFSLYSNFTFFSADPRRGDMIHQRDARTTYGVKLRYERDDTLGFLGLTTRAGMETRADRIRNGLDHAPERELREARVDATVRETALSAYLEEELAWSRFVRTTAGVRADYFVFDVGDHLEDRSTNGTRSSGTRSAQRVSPKASIVLSPFEQLDVFGNFGLGFHSNDARGVMLGVTPLTQAIAYETGLLVRPLERLELRIDLFRIDLDSELVWVGDEGTTEASGRTRREGIEADLRLELVPWLWSDLSASFTRARFLDAARGEDAVPLAPTRILSGSLTAQHPRGPFGRLSVLHIGDRPANEDRSLTAQGFVRVDASAGYRAERYELALSAQNLLNAAWREAQFATTSRLRGETAVSDCPEGTQGVTEGGRFVGCDDIHFTPGTPFSVQASGSVFF